MDINSVMDVLMEDFDVTVCEKWSDFEQEPLSDCCGAPAIGVTNVCSECKNLAAFHWSEE